DEEEDEDDEKSSEQSDSSSRENGPWPARDGQRRGGSSTNTDGSAGDDGVNCSGTERRDGVPRSRATSRSARGTKEEEREDSEEEREDKEGDEKEEEDEGEKEREDDEKQDEEKEEHEKKEEEKEEEDEEKPEEYIFTLTGTDDDFYVVDRTGLRSRFEEDDDELRYENAFIAVRTRREPARLEVRGDFALTLQRRRSGVISVDYDDGARRVDADRQAFRRFSYRGPEAVVKWDEARDDLDAYWVSPPPRVERSK
ncbi:hypothetical protein, partial [Haloarchaeobius sp. DFWS5]|uniref:hypothetical protein n=1 Tax=Haloarchaeobius sp. DFWS5 TaxID=3446114 RepID=UPI003EC05BC1